MTRRASGNPDLHLWGRREKAASIDGGDGDGHPSTTYNNSFTLHWRSRGTNSLERRRSDLAYGQQYDGGPGDDRDQRHGRQRRDQLCAFFGRGDGHDLVESGFTRPTPSTTNILKFKDGVFAARHSGQPRRLTTEWGVNGAIRFKIVDTGDSIVFDLIPLRLQFERSFSNMVQQVQFADGTVWNRLRHRGAHHIASRMPRRRGSSGQRRHGRHHRRRLSRGLRAGDDTLDGGAGDDYPRRRRWQQYVPVRLKASGHDTIVYQANPSPSRVNTLRMKAGVQPSDVELREVPTSGTIFSSDLRVTLKSTGETVTVAGHFVPVYPTYTCAWSPVQQIVFDDGTVWTTAQIDALVFAGTSGSDRLIANTPSTLNGGDGNDLLIGSIAAGGGADVLLGGAGDDIIAAGNGDDTIVGGPGRDRIWGGPGNNTYVFHRGDGQDLIEMGNNQGYPDSNSVLSLPDIASTDVRHPQALGQQPATFGTSCR